MKVEGGSNFGSGSGSIQQVRLKPGPAFFADAAEVWSDFHDAESANCHEPSLPLAAYPVDFKRHHYRAAE